MAVSLAKRAAADPAQPGRSLPALQGEDETLMQSFEGVELYLGTVLLGTGTLHVSTRYVYWLDNAGKADLKVEIRKVMMHAVCRDDPPFVRPCLYCQLDSCEGALGEGSYGSCLGQGGGGDAGEEGEDPIEEDAEAPPQLSVLGGRALAEVVQAAEELRLVVTQDPEAGAERLFESFSDAAALNPDPDLEGEGDWISTASTRRQVGETRGTKR
eukprot:RCo004617